MKRFESGLIEFVRARYNDIPTRIAEQGDLPDDMREKLQRAVEEFKAGFPKTETPQTAS